MVPRDEKFMQMAINLAQRGAGYVSPNPLVGAVITRNGKIIGQGYHAKFGSDHAEINAMGHQSVEGSTLYVTLEPCNHYGKTPPCLDRIIAEKIKKVVIGSGDPDPRMRGKSIEKLISAGITVKTGVLRPKTDELIRWYSHWIRTGYPYVTIKLAVSSDGLIARKNGDSRWISCLTSRREAHRLRSYYDAVMVGTNTHRMDDPALTVRLVKGRNPNRIVLDRKGILPPSLKVFLDNTKKIFYFTSIRRTDLPEHVEVIVRDKKGFQLERILKILGAIGQQSILVEGGALLAESLIEKNLCQEVILYRSNKVLRRGVEFRLSSMKNSRFDLFEKAPSGSDEKIIYRQKCV